MLEQRHDEARRKRVACGRAVDDLDVRGCGAGDLLPVLEQDRALRSERESDEAVGASERRRARSD